MSSFCITDCLDPAEFPQFDFCDLEKGRVDGYEDPIAFRCDFSFTNILDPTEWTAGIENGGILKFPCGSFIPGAPTQDEIKRHCDKITYDINKYPAAVYSSGYVWADDEPYWAQVEERQCFGQFQRFIFKRCAGDQLVLPSAQIKAIRAGLAGGGAVPVTSPGFTLNMTTPMFAAVNGAGGHGEWTSTMEFSNSGVMQSIDLPAVCQAIKAASYTG